MGPSLANPSSRSPFPNYDDDDDADDDDHHHDNDDDDDEHIVGPPNPFFNDEPLVAPGGPSHPLLLHLCFNHHRHRCHRHYNHCHIHHIG